MDATSAAEAPSIPTDDRAVVIDDRSSVFLVYAFDASPHGRFDVKDFHVKMEPFVKDRQIWSPGRIDTTALLPHIDQELKDAKSAAGGPPALLSYFQPGARLGQWVRESPAFRLSYEDGKDRTCWLRISTVKATPYMYVFDTGLIFVVVQVAPLDMTLAAVQDALHGVVRKNCSTVEWAEEGGRHFAGWRALHAERHWDEASADTIRAWLACLLPDVGVASPVGAPKAYGFACIGTMRALTAEERHNLRLFRGAHQDSLPSADDAREDNPEAVYRAAGNQLWLFAKRGFVTVHETSSVDDRTFDDTLTTFRRKYLLMGAVVLNQRLVLLRLSASVAKLATSLDMDEGEDTIREIRDEFARLRRELLRFLARHNFSQVSDEERHARHYSFFRNGMDVERLMHEVRDEVTEIEDHLRGRHEERMALLEQDAARANDRMQRVLGVLTAWLTPTSIFVSLLQIEWFRQLPHAAVFAAVTIAGSYYLQRSIVGLSASDRSAARPSLTGRAVARIAEDRSGGARTSSGSVRS